MLHPAEWYRFNDRILIYNTRRDKWEEAVRAKISLVPVLH